MHALVTWPDIRLRQPSVPVAQIDARIHALYHALCAAMAAEHGLGLAASQLGDPTQMFIVAATLLGQGGDAAPVAFINPEVIWTSAFATQTAVEGCLSFPGIYIPVTRPQQCIVHALGLDGQRFTCAGEGLLARCLLHECDHLTGKLLIDFLAAPDGTPLPRR